MKSMKFLVNLFSHRRPLPPTQRWFNDGQRPFLSHYRQPSPPITAQRWFMVGTGLGCRQSGGFGKGSLKEIEGEKEMLLGHYRGNRNGGRVYCLPGCTDITLDVDISAFNLKGTKLIAFNIRNQGSKNLCWAFDVASFAEYWYKILNPKRPQIIFSALRIAECLWPELPAYGCEWPIPPADGCMCPDLPPNGYNHWLMLTIDWVYERGLVSMIDGPDTEACGAYPRSPHVERYFMGIRCRWVDLSNDDLDQVLRVGPVMGAIYVDDTFGKIPFGMVYEGPIQTHAPPVHFVLIIASEKYEGRDILIYQNSWGSGHGHNGLGRMLRYKPLSLTGIYKGFPDDYVHHVNLLFEAVALVV